MAAVYVDVRNVTVKQSEALGKALIKYFRPHHDPEDIKYFAGEGYHTLVANTNSKSHQTFNTQRDVISIQSFLKKYPIGRKVNLKGILCK